MTEEELRELVARGARVGRSVEKGGGEFFYVYVPWERRVRRVPKHLSEVARQLAGQQGDPQPQRAEGAPQAAAAAVRARGDDVLRELARRYSELVRVVGEKAEWWTRALTDIGFYATLAALNFARVDPEEFAARVKGFRSAEEFSSFVLGYLDAMVKAGGDAAEQVSRLQDRVRELEAFRLLAESVVGRLAAQRDAALKLYSMAVASMCDSCRRRLTVALSVSQLGEVGVVEGG